MPGTRKSERMHGPRRNRETKDGFADIGPRDEDGVWWPLNLAMIYAKCPGDVYAPAFLRSKGWERRARWTDGGVVYEWRAPLRPNPTPFRETTRGAPPVAESVRKAIAMRREGETRLVTFRDHNGNVVDSVEIAK